MTFFALPDMAPLAAAAAAPLRYHHCGVSPSGWAMAGTCTRGALAGAGAVGGVLAQAAGSRAESRARGRARV